MNGSDRDSQAGGSGPTSSAVEPPLDIPEAPAPERRHSPIGILVGIFSSLVFTWLAVRNLDWSAAGQALKQVRWGYIALYVAAACGIQLIRMIRWSLMLHSLGDTRWGRTMSVGAVGLTAIFFLPARLGELIRPLLIADPDRVGMGEAVATVVVERLIDGIMVGVMLVVVGLWVEDSLSTAATIRSAGLAVGGIFLGLSAVILVATWYSGLSQRLLRRLYGRWRRLAARLMSLVSQFRHGLFSLFRTRHTISYTLLSAVMWVFNGLSVLLLFAAFQMDLPPVAAFVILSAQSVGILVPAAPTSIGTFHFAVMWSISLYSLPQADAFNFAVVFHLAQVVANLLIGLGGIATGGLSGHTLRWLGRGGAAGQAVSR
ncbi:MAG: flippase-like domain-containing protein [Bradymonadales bacterium]|nr:flippase-like domain-containing protein [Bradymonadales bacterium]